MSMQTQAFLSALTVLSIVLLPAIVMMIIQVRNIRASNKTKQIFNSYR